MKNNTRPTKGPTDDGTDSASNCGVKCFEGVERDCGTATIEIRSPPNRESSIRVNGYAYDDEPAHVELVLKVGHDLVRFTFSDAEEALAVADDLSTTAREALEAEL
jgi:hypothetical protein